MPLSDSRFATNFHRRLCEAWDETGRDRKDFKACLPDFWRGLADLMRSRSRSMPDSYDIRRRLFAYQFFDMLPPELRCCTHLDGEIMPLINAGDAPKGARDVIGIVQFSKAKSGIGCQSA